jgi:hypothetical protein
MVLDGFSHAVEYSGLTTTKIGRRQSCRTMTLVPTFTRP